MQQYGSLRAVIPLLQQAIQAYSTQHPEEDFPLLGDFRKRHYYDRVSMLR